MGESATKFNLAEQYDDTPCDSGGFRGSPFYWTSPTLLKARESPQFSWMLVQGIISQICCLIWLGFFGIYIYTCIHTVYIYTCINIYIYLYIYTYVYKYGSIWTYDSMIRVICLCYAGESAISHPTSRSKGQKDMTSTIGVSTCSGLLLKITSICCAGKNSCVWWLVFQNFWFKVLVLPSFWLLFGEHEKSHSNLFEGYFTILLAAPSIITKFKMIHLPSYGCVQILQMTMILWLQTRTQWLDCLASMPGDIHKSYSNSDKSNHTSFGGFPWIYHPFRSDFRGHCAVEKWVPSRTSAGPTGWHPLRCIVRWPTKRSPLRSWAPARWCNAWAVASCWSCPVSRIHGEMDGDGKKPWEKAEMKWKYWESNWELVTEIVMGDENSIFMI